jgi:hypothetical protein
MHFVYLYRPTDWIAGHDWWSCFLATFETLAETQQEFLFEKKKIIVSGKVLERRVVTWRSLIFPVELASWWGKWHIWAGKKTLDISAPSTCQGSFSINLGTRDVDDCTPFTVAISSEAELLIRVVSSTLGWISIMSRGRKCAAAAAALSYRRQ